MKHVTLKLSLLALMACGKTYQVDTSLEVYVQEFKSIGAEYGFTKEVDNLIMEFGDSTEYIQNSVAVCMRGGITPKVVIDTEYWNSKYTSDIDKQLTVFHELGHCLLNRSHRHDQGNGGAPLTIMFPYVFQPDEDVPLDLFYAELFTNPDTSGLVKIFKGFFSEFYPDGWYGYGDPRNNMRTSSVNVVEW